MSIGVLKRGEDVQLRTCPKCDFYIPARLDMCPNCWPLSSGFYVVPKDRPLIQAELFTQPNSKLSHPASEPSIPETNV